MKRLLYAGVLVAILLAVSTMPALAAKPSVESGQIEFSDIFPAEDGCGFPILVEGTTDYRIKEFFDRDGELVRAISNYTTSMVWTNLDSGTSITMRDVSRVNFHEIGLDVIIDEETITYRAIVSGVYGKAVVPGVGVVWMSAGVLEFVLVETHEGEYVEDYVIVHKGREYSDIENLFEKLCPALA